MSRAERELELERLVAVAVAAEELLVELENARINYLARLARLKLKLALKAYNDE